MKDLAFQLSATERDGDDSLTVEGLAGQRAVDVDDSVARGDSALCLVVDASEVMEELIRADRPGLPMPLMDEGCKRLVCRCLE